MSNDAAFREALDMCLEMHANYGSVSVPALTAARARVLALTAERQGEVYEVAFIQPDCGDPTVPEHAEEWGVGLHGTMPGWLHPGAPVRVVRVEEK